MLMILILNILTTKNNNIIEFVSESKNISKEENYLRLLSKCYLMDITDYEKSIPKTKTILHRLSNFVYESHELENSLKTVECIRDSLETILHSENKDQLNKFKCMKLQSEIELLNRILENNDSDQRFKFFLAWFNYRRKFAIHIDKALYYYHKIIKDIEKLLSDQAATNEISEKFKSKLYLGSLFRSMINYGEILAIKDSIESDNNTEPAKIYLKSFIKALDNENSRIRFNCSNNFLLNSRKLFNNDGSIPNSIKDFSNQLIPLAESNDFKEFSLIVLEELNNMQIDEINEKVVAQIINNIYKKHGVLLNQYQFWFQKSFNEIAIVCGLDEFSYYSKRVCI